MLGEQKYSEINTYAHFIYRQNIEATFLRHIRTFVVYHLAVSYEVFFLSICRRVITKLG